MRHCITCNAKMPVDEYFCSERCFEAWEQESHRTPGYTILDVESPRSTKRTKKPFISMAVDYDLLPF